MHTDQRLTLEFGDGSRVDEYRIREDQLEFRVRQRDPSSTQKSNQWTRLTPADVAMHVELGTVVGQWLRVRRPERTRVHP